MAELKCQVIFHVRSELVPWVFYSYILKEKGHLLCRPLTSVCAYVSIICNSVYVMCHGIASVIANELGSKPLWEECERSAHIRPYTLLHKSEKKRSDNQKKSLPEAVDCWLTMWMYLWITICPASLTQTHTNKSQLFTWNKTAIPQALVYCWKPKSHYPPCAAPRITGNTLQYIADTNKQTNKNFLAHISTVSFIFLTFLW